MKFDRGFIKWQPFNSVIQSSVLLNNIAQNEHEQKPTLFPEEIESLNKELMEAYYSHNLIELTIYEENKIKKYESIITELNSSNNTIHLKNNKTIYFNQIIHLRTI